MTHDTPKIPQAPQAPQASAGEPAPGWWHALQTLLAQEGELFTLLQGAASPGKACELLAAALARQGLSVAPGEVAAHLNLLTQTACEETLSDEALDAVAGGVSSNDTEFAAMRYSMLMVRYGRDCSLTSEKPWLQPGFKWVRPT